jgi:hypothetical protein
MSISVTARGGAFTARGGWNPKTTYFQDDFVVWQGVEYQSILPVNTGNQPDTSPWAWVIPASAGGASLKPPPGRVYVWVDADFGNDSNDGRSYGTPLKTVAAAIAQMPNGGPIGLAPSASTYSITAPLNLCGHTIESVGRAPGGSQGLAILEHNFNGDMIACGSCGAFLRNLLLYQDFTVTGRTGAALTGTSSSSVGGEIIGENLIFAGGDGWERALVLDGTAWITFGIRKCVFTNCQFFGARTPGEAIKITRGVHCKFVGGFLDQAPAAGVNQGIRLLDVGTTDVQFIGFRILGDFYTEAGGGVLYEGIINGNIIFGGGSAYNSVVGTLIGGTVTNNGDPATNGYNFNPPVWILAASLLQNGWTDNGAGYRVSGYSKHTDGDVALRGRISGGTPAAGTVLLTLPAGYRPGGGQVESRLVWALNQTGVMTPVDITINGAGTTTLATSLAGSGTFQSLDLGGIRFSTL